MTRIVWTARCVSGKGCRHFYNTRTCGEMHAAGNGAFRSKLEQALVVNIHSRSLCISH